MPRGRPRGSKNRPATEEEEQAELFPQPDNDYWDFVNAIDPEEVGTVQIYRMDKHHATRKKYLMTVESSLMIAPTALDYLRDKLGPGEYILLFRKGGQYYGSRMVSIGELREDNGIPGYRPAGGDEGQMTIMREMMARSDQMHQQMMQTIVAIMGVNRGPDVGSLLQGLAAFKPAPAADPSAMMTQIVATLAPLFTANKPAAEPDWIERTKSLVGLAKELGGGSDSEETTVLSMVKDVAVEVAKNVTMGAMGNPGHARPVQAVVTNNRPVAETARPAIEGAAPGSANENPPAAVEEAEMFANLLRNQLTFLKDKALKGKDPDFWVDFILENQEEQGCAALLAALEKGATWDDLLRFDPEIQKNAVLSKWFRRFYDALIGQISRGPDGDPGGAGGDEGHASEDEGSGVSGGADRKG